MTFEIGLVLCIIAVAIALFIWERFSMDTVAILVMLAFILSGILTPEEGFAGFVNPATITVATLFVLSAAIFRSGALNSVGGLLTKVGKKSYTLFLLTLMIVAGILSAFINDTAVVALFMPIVLQVSRDTKISASKMLMPLSFGALMGGVCTLLGTSTNILVSGIAKQHGEEPFGIFELTRGGIWFLLAGVVYMVTIGQFILPKRKQDSDLTDAFDLGNYLTEVTLLSNSPSVEKPFAESPIGQDENMQVVQVRREGHSIVPSATFVLKAGDQLSILCNIERLAALQDRRGIKIKADKKIGEKDLAANDTKLYEVMIPLTSLFVDRSLSDLNFRNKYRAVVLAIRNRVGTQYEKLNKVKLQQGDVLLIKASSEQMLQLKESEDLLLLSEYQAEKFNLSRMLPTLLIATGVVVSAAIGLASIAVCALVGVLLLIMIRSLTPEQAYQAVEWKVVFMLAGVLSMGAALQKTGADTLLAGCIVKYLGALGPHAVLSAFFFSTFMLTNVMSNNATAALLAPIAIVTAHAMEVDTRPFLMAVTFAASLSFMSPVGYQTNAMIYGPGNYKFIDYLKVGTPLNLLLWFLASLILPWMYPF